jgi:predicted lipoprotein with Yx(FWY)xxD motif
MPVSRHSTFPASLAVLLITAVSVAACGGGGGATAAPAPPKTSSGPAATIGVANTGLGKILVDSQGRTLYLFKLDSIAQSVCTAACATAWPPLLAQRKPTVGGAAKASLLAAIQFRPLEQCCDGIDDRPAAFRNRESFDESGVFGGHRGPGAGDGQD